MKTRLTVCRPNSLCLWGLAVAGTLTCACGPTLDEGADARIRVTPAHQVAFSRVTPGDTRTLPFVITSVGRDALDVQKIEWNGPASVSLVSAERPVPVSLENQASMPVSVQFTPTQDQPSPNGTILIYSNDPDTPVYTLDVVAQQLAAQIHVVPSAEEKLLIGQTEPGLTTTKDVVVSNVGDLPLQLTQISLNTTSDFKYALPQNQPLPVTLAANAANSLTIRVSFTPSAPARQEGSLALTSNDPTTPIYTLPIIANSNTPCLTITPSLLEFSPSVSIGTSKTQDVLLTSCSDVPLVIEDVVQTSGSNLFTHSLKGTGAPLAKGESATLAVTYAPQTEGTHQAQFVILNNDPMQPNATLSVMGSASTNQCPTANARGRLSTSSTWAKNLDLAPLDTVILDGSLSFDKESSSLEYFWSVKSAPHDSTSKIAADGDKASFFIDLAGNYELCLSVQDSAQMMSCNTDCVTIQAVPRETIHVQLVWNTPADSITGDSDGSDLDLHFLTLPTGTWGDTGSPQLNNGTDVYFQNRAPIWQASQIQEEPSLDRDDKDGEGPENVNLDKPEACRWYAIGVHYYNDYGFGPSQATVRIYVNGKMYFEKAAISMTQTGVFKHIAWMFWDGSNGRFYESDFAVTHDEDWIGLTPTVPDDVIQKAKVSSPKCFE